MKRINPDGDCLRDLNMSQLNEKKKLSLVNLSSDLFEEYISSRGDDNCTEFDKNLKSNPEILKLSPINERLNKSSLNPFGINLGYINFTSHPSSLNPFYSNFFEEYISPSADAYNENIDFDNFKSISQFLLWLTYPVKTIYLTCNEKLTKEFIKYKRVNLQRYSKVLGE
ncbi:hypothetical protein CDAR_562051 [Caerostris darwini]|uniref:PIR Superfamily Protein n=1 Tax=Caerostris darwini TaxID=1538125 RepID=A0AAV4PA89_9ARAC|nr:hypothetical protein CDAR_562051 [Caerostris darwini]